MSITSTGCGAWISTIGRVVERLLQLGAGAERRQLAGLDDGDAVAVLRLVEVVRGDEDGHAALREVADQVPEPPARHRIDAAGRLVEEHDRRLVQDGAAEGQPLPPAARQFAGERALAARAGRPCRGRSARRCSKRSPDRP